MNNRMRIKLGMRVRARKGMYMRMRMRTRVRTRKTEPVLRGASAGPGVAPDPGAAFACIRYVRAVRGHGLSIPT